MVRGAASVRFFPSSIVAFVGNGSGDVGLHVLGCRVDTLLLGTDGNGSCRSAGFYTDRLLKRLEK